MKHTILSIAMAAATFTSLSTQAMPGHQQLQGVIERQGSHFYVVSQNNKTQLTGMQFNDLLRYEGLKVEISGETSAKGLDVYKLHIFTQGKKKQVYDWETINQMLYES